MRRLLSGRESDTLLDVQASAQLSWGLSLSTPRPVLSHRPGGSHGSSDILNPPL